MIQQINKKLISNKEKLKLIKTLNDSECVNKKIYKKLNSRKSAPNCVQKNIK